MRHRRLAQAVPGWPSHSDPTSGPRVATPGPALADTLPVMNEFADAEADLSPAETARRMADENLLLIDVRENYEWDAGRVPASRHIPVENIASEAPSIPKDRPVAFICLGGVRSAMVTRAFRDAGFNAFNVTGGFAEWFGQGLPTEPEGARVAPH